LVLVSRLLVLVRQDRLRRVKLKLRHSVNKLL
jgi:hypothetical protein